MKALLQHETTKAILHFIACLAFSAAFLTVSAFGFLALIILQANS